MGSEIDDNIISSSVDGADDGAPVGSSDGAPDGPSEGEPEGSSDGETVGPTDASLDGETVGPIEWSSDGAPVVPIKTVGSGDGTPTSPDLSTTAKSIQATIMMIARMHPHVIFPPRLQIALFSRWFFCL